LRTRGSWGTVWAPLLRNSGGVGGCVCSGRPLLFSMFLSMPFSLSLSPACRQCGTQAGPRPASLRARVSKLSKPFEFEAPVNSLEFSPLLASRAALPRPYRCSPRQPIPFHCPSSSHQHEAESLLPAYLLCPPGFSFLQPPFGPLSSLLFTIVS